MTIYRLTDTMATNGPVSTLITIVRSTGGHCYAFDGYTEKAVSSAKGGGYDKRNTALQRAIEKITGVKLEVNGASGERAVCMEAKRKGIIIEGLNHEGNWDKTTN